MHPPLPRLRPSPPPERRPESYTLPRSPQTGHTADYPDMRPPSPRAIAASGLLELSAREVVHPSPPKQQLWAHSPYHSPYAQTATAASFYNHQPQQMQVLPPQFGQPQVVGPEGPAALLEFAGGGAWSWRREDPRSGWHVFQHFDHGNQWQGQDHPDYGWVEDNYQHIAMPAPDTIAPSTTNARQAPFEGLTYAAIWPAAPQAPPAAAEHYRPLQQTAIPQCGIPHPVHRPVNTASSSSTTISLASSSTFLPYRPRESSPFYSSLQDVAEEGMTTIAHVNDSGEGERNSLCRYQYDGG